MAMTVDTAHAVATASFVDKVLAWCERTDSDILSTFDVTDEEWSILRPRHIPTGGLAGRVARIEEARA